MLNIIAKFLLVLTSLSPVLFVIGVNQFERGKPWVCCIIWIALALVSVVFCWGMLKYSVTRARDGSIYIKEFERKDQEMLTFLFIYLLPFLRSENSTFASEWLTSTCCLAIVILAIAHVGAFHFNPIMRLLGYRFYAVKNRHGVSNLLISRKDLQRPDREVKRVQLARNVYLYAGDLDV